MTWVLVIYLVTAEQQPRIVIDGFHKLDDCRFIGQTYVELIQPKARYRCDEVRR